MNNYKIQRYESIIQDKINKTIVFKVNNKYIKMARVSYVKLDKNLNNAKVYLDCQKREEKAQILENFQKLTALFRAEVASELDIFKTPKITFFHDLSIEHAEKIDNIIKDIHSKEK
jgi:ribosome-binding factor A